MGNFEAEFWLCFLYEAFITCLYSEHLVSGSIRGLNKFKLGGGGTYLYQNCKKSIISTLDLCRFKSIYLFDVDSVVA